VFTVVRSQLTSLVSALLLLSVLLYLGPYFEPLPVCVLGSIIMVALTGLLLKVRSTQMLNCTQYTRVIR
jgi:solute carrier family 26, other